MSLLSVGSISLDSTSSPRDLYHTAPLSGDFLRRTAQQAQLELRLSCGSVHGPIVQLMNRLLSDLSSSPLRPNSKTLTRRQSRPTLA
jgi:hypothetical protein